ncbi:hypothetical protein BY458DRAFT_500411 [Sporodiniella umbellata]|nr:hypothetical protein BY458DRAFT_500411 [Sporodiniella umbellata]
MKSITHKRRKVACPYKNQSDSSRKHIFKYDQACNLLNAMEINQRKPLTKKCIAHLAIYVAQTWESNPCKEKVQQLFCMMSSLLDTQTNPNEPFEISLQKYCTGSNFMPALCPSTTLLVAINYIERLNRKYQGLKGTSGCGSRMIYIAYSLAAKHIYHCLRLVIYTKEAQKPITPPTSPKIPTFQQSYTNDEKKHKIERMEKEFLCFLDYDLSVSDPTALVYWAHSYDDTLDTLYSDREYTSADEGDDEMDDEDDATL